MLQSVGTFVQQNADWMQALAVAVMAGYGAFKLFSIITTVVGFIKAFSLADTVAAAKQWLLNAAMNANPIMLVVTAISALVAALVWFFTQTETGRKAWAAFTSFVSSAWQKTVDAVTSLGQNIANFFTQTLPNAFQSVVQWFQRLPGTYRQRIVEPAHGCGRMGHLSRAIRVDRREPVRAERRVLHHALA